MERIKLSDHFTYIRLLRFTMPTILMLLSASLYGVVDGLFIANCAGKTAFAAVNLIWPFPMLLGAIGYMFGAGGCALVSKTMGEGYYERARSYFTMLTITAVACGFLFASIGIFFIDDIANMLGAKSGMIHVNCVVYGRYIMAAMPLFILQCMFQPYMIAAEKPKWGLAIIFVAGCVNVLLDYYFLYNKNMGVAGAGLATMISQAVGAVLPMFLFVGKKHSKLYFVSKIKIEPLVLAKTCANGASEFIVNASMPFVNLLYVYALWKVAGEDGVGAYGVIMYVNIVFFSFYNGLAMGSSPIISFHYGAHQMYEVRNVKRIVFCLLSISGLLLFVVAELTSPMIAGLFSKGDEVFGDIIERSFSLYALSFLFAPYNIYASAFFTALNNGKVSAAISFSRILFFQVGALLTLPIWFGIDGFWMALPIAEVLCLGLSIFLYLKFKPLYNY